MSVLQEGVRTKTQSHGSGGEHGLTLAKIGFALRIKFSKQYSTLTDFADSLRETGSQSPRALVEQFNDDEQYRTLMQQWLKATELRMWF